MLCRTDFCSVQPVGTVFKVSDSVFRRLEASAKQFFPARAEKPGCRSRRTDFEGVGSRYEVDYSRVERKIETPTLREQACAHRVRKLVTPGENVSIAATKRRNMVMAYSVRARLPCPFCVRRFVPLLLSLADTPPEFAIGHSVLRTSSIIIPRSIFDVHKNTPACLSRFLWVGRRAHSVSLRVMLLLYT